MQPGERECAMPPLRGKRFLITILPENFAADFSSSLVFCKYGKKRTKLLDRYYGPGVNTCRSRHAYGAL